MVSVAMRFDGSDYDHDIDSPRLTDQHLRVRELMKDHVWRTLREISEGTGDPEASVSAQLRHLRKPRFGSWVVEKRPRSDRKNGLFEYRLMPTGHDSEFVITGRRNKQREALKALLTHTDCTDDMRRLALGILK